MGAVKVSILCSISEGSCERVQALIKEPFKVTEVSGYNKYEFSGEFEGTSEMQRWAKEICVKSGYGITSISMTPENQADPVHAGEDIKMKIITVLFGITAVFSAANLFSIYFRELP